MRQTETDQGLFDKKMPLKLKSKVYEVIVRPALTRGSDCWAMKTNNKRKIATTKMRVLLGTLGVSRLKRVRNEEIRQLLNLPPIDKVMRSEHKDERRKMSPTELSPSRYQVPENEDAQGRCGNNRPKR